MQPLSIKQKICNKSGVERNEKLINETRNKMDDWGKVYNVLLSINK